MQIPVNPCSTSICGQNSQCREINNQAVCSCLPTYLGLPPACRPECVVIAECAQDQACMNQKCVNPCVGVCGLRATCQVLNHNPICTCPAAHTGDPFVSCVFVASTPPVIVNACQPSPCGPNSICNEVNGNPSCTCMQHYQGQPPQCRPECISNSECSSHLACINKKCKDPCPAACGLNAECRVVSHSAVCVCPQGYSGDPFTQCSIRQSEEILTPCSPSPCGPNAYCREQNTLGSCTCNDAYFGNPYEGCRPECTLDSDCPGNRACIGNKCQDPCPGRCGENAECSTVGHLPICICKTGFTGDPHRRCNAIPGK